MVIWLHIPIGEIAVIIIIIIIKVTMLKKHQSGIIQPMVGLQVTVRGYTFCMAMQGGRVYYKTFMGQTLMRMSERFTMNVHIYCKYNSRSFDLGKLG